MEKESKKERNYCVLIDSDNISPKYIKGILDEVAKFGVAQIKRLYGDMSNPINKNWKEVSLEYSITPIQQYNYTSGKNATDSSMIINAMDILYSKDLDGFVIVSSDSDFTGLAIRLREECKEVIGMGEKKTPRPFITACTEFKYLENLLEDETAKPILLDNTKAIKEAIIKIISENDGPLLISLLTERLLKIHPDFDTRNYGYSKMHKFLESIAGIDVVKDSKAFSVNVKNVDKKDNHKNSIDNEIAEAIAIVTKAPKSTINMGKLHNRLKEKFPEFNYKSLGFSQFAAFINSSEELETRKTSVTLRKKIKSKI